MPTTITVREREPKHSLDAPPPALFGKIRMVTVSRPRIAMLITAVITTAAAVVIFALGIHRPTIASNVAVGTWIMFVALTIGQNLSRALDAIRADTAHDEARAELVTTGSLRCSHLRRVD